ncbi:unnamed protein product [Pieris macdunnoughi]|uniref:Uncharacterized protein n=1 Tax=Pieris macdunnoughi TaxID=345717 RepID=A0A821QTY4_9NEOP|nr:unnamed protein product [Pieris macdunnoughi]
MTMTLRLFLFALIVSTECGYHNFMFGYKNKYKGYKKYSKEHCCPDDPGYNVIKHLELADKLLKTKCTNYHSVQEVYENDVYRVKYKFKRNIEDFIQVKINYRVIYVIINEVSSEIKDIRVIPPGLQTKNATWRLDSDLLIVNIPYKFERLTEIQADCKEERKYSFLAEYLGYL